MLRSLAVVVATVLCTLPAGAEEPAQPNLQALQSILGEVKPDSVTPSPLPGIYEVMLGARVLYLSQDGRYLIQGDIVDLSTRDNVTENRRDALRAKAVAALGEDNMVVFAPDSPARHTVTVFTDIDCGYCRKLHQEIAEYNKQGIKVRYVWYPRAGIGSDSYDKAVAVWCAADRRDALTRAKRGEEIEHKSCENPVKAQFELGQALGVRGTPSLILEDGQMVPGYVPAAKLAQMLDSAKPAATPR